MAASIVAPIAAPTITWQRAARRVLVVVLSLHLSACASFLPTSRPAKPEDLCQIYLQKPSWYKDSIKASKRWGGPLAVSMAIMYQESAFKARAKPPRKRLLGVIPWRRPSNAYGYPQALDSTWKWYRSEAGGHLRQRSDFTDAIDFIHWYMHKTYKANRIKKADAYNQYLNYHEGQGGFASGSYKRKQWLINTATRVHRRAVRYSKQYRDCKARLERFL